MGTLISLVLSVLGSLLFAVLYGLGAPAQAEGVALALASFGLCGGLVGWAKSLLAQETVIDERDPLPSPLPEREAALAAWSEGACAVIDRRTWLVRLLGASGEVFGLGVLWTALRSLGPAPGRTLFHTAWRRGDRLVRDDGNPVCVDELENGSFLTVFPEEVIRAGDLDAAANAATVLLRVEAALLRLPSDRQAWAPQGCLAYSKVCTHAGCPVGLYRQQTHQLLCPCHQSTFDVLDGATVVFGPAARPLPQLPIEVGEDGYLRASSDYTEAIGPGFWERGSG